METPIPITSFNQRGVGGVFKSSKYSYEWVFSVSGQENILQLLKSTMSGKIRVLLNNQMIHYEQKPIGDSFYHSKVVGGIKIVVSQKGKSYQAKIFKVDAVGGSSNHQFAHPTDQGLYQSHQDSRVIGGHQQPTNSGRRGSHIPSTYQSSLVDLTPPPMLPPSMDQGPKRRMTLDHRNHNQGIHQSQQWQQTQGRSTQWQNRQEDLIPPPLHGHRQSKNHFSPDMGKKDLSYSVNPNSRMPNYPNHRQQHQQQYQNNKYQHHGMRRSNSDHIFDERQVTFIPVE